MVKMKQHTPIAAPVVAGIDVSKAHLDVYLHPEGKRRRFNNDKTGWRALRDWLAKTAPDHVVYEATGRYHKGFERYLGGHGLPIAHLDRESEPLALGNAVLQNMQDLLVLADHVEDDPMGLIRREAAFATIEEELEVSNEAPVPIQPQDSPPPQEVSETNSGGCGCRLSQSPATKSLVFSTFYLLLLGLSFRRKRGGKHPNLEAEGCLIE